jgi:hypothetical protein
MPLIRRKFITRQHLRANRDILFVFGDNLARKGYAGQADEMRGEPNAVGLPTKRNPWHYLRDFELEEIIENTEPERNKLIQHLATGGTVVWPADGIGTGLARLREHAPKIADYYDEFLKSLESIGGAIQCP